MTAPLTPRICKREGCTSHAKSRQMCPHHYMKWYSALEVKPTRQKSSDLALVEMPGTLREIAARAGLSYEATIRAVAALRAAGLAHVAEVLPPGETILRWMDVFGAGPGEDVKVSRHVKLAFAKRGRRIKHHAMRAVRVADPMVSALFGMGAV